VTYTYKVRSVRTHRLSAKYVHCCTWFLSYLQGGPNNWHTFSCTPKLRQILTDLQIYLFHCLNQENICNNNVTKDPTTPQVCRFTNLWKFSVFQATTENKTTSVTTHFKSASSSNNAYTLNIWYKNRMMRQLLQLITETINTLFPVVNFSKNMLLHKSSCFQLLLLRQWHFTRQCSNTLEVWWDL